jgi:hypothetical protein
MQASRGVDVERNGMRAIRAVVGATLALIGCCSTAFASAGAPDPSFGLQGIAELPERSTPTSSTSFGAPVVLPDGRVAVPEFRYAYRVRRGERAAITSASMRLSWLGLDGRIERSSERVALPVNLNVSRVVRTSTGHLLVIGVRYRDRYRPTALYVLRLSADGVPEAAPGGTSTAVTTQLSSIPNLGSDPARTEVGAISVASSGRVFVALRQDVVREKPQPETTGYGPVVIAAIDPSFGLASSFAAGGLIVAPASDTRTAVATAIATDETGRLLVLARSTRIGIGGTSQEVSLSRYDAAGALDATFAAGGRIDIDGGNIDVAYDGTPGIAVLRGGDVVTRMGRTAESDGFASSGIELRRFAPTGTPVPTFGTAGVAQIVLQRIRTDGSTSSSWSSFGFRTPTELFEQPDGKLLLDVDRSGFSASRVVDGPVGVLRTTVTGQLDASYAKDGFARFDAPWSFGVAGTLVGIDGDGRAIGFVSTYSDPARSGVARLLAGDVTAPVASATLRVDGRACGATRARACFDADGSVTITGRVMAAGRGVAGASVVVDVSRPSEASIWDESPALPSVRTKADGRFSVRLARSNALPGTWQASARVIATRSSQRVDRTRPVFFTLGPRADIATFRLVRRSQALAVALSYIVDDTIETDENEDPISQCRTPKACFGRSAELLARVSSGANPAPGMAGLVVRRPGNYTIVTRMPTDRFRLEFVITSTPVDTIYSCRGDAAARARWCPDGTWDDVFDDPFVTAGIDGAPFDW